MPSLQCELTFQCILHCLLLFVWSALTIKAKNFVFYPLILYKSRYPGKPSRPTTPKLMFFHSPISLWLTNKKLWGVHFVEINGHFQPVPYFLGQDRMVISASINYHQQGTFSRNWTDAAVIILNFVKYAVNL